MPGTVAFVCFNADIIIEQLLTVFCEGVVIGVVATAFSILLLGMIYHFIYNEFNSVLIGNIGFGLLQFSDIFQIAIFVYAVLGIGIGVFGSVLSMKKYLKV